MLDERPLRKPTCDEANSVPVDFDAGTFLVPKPFLRLRPTFKGRRVESSRIVTPDAEFDALRRAAIDAPESEAFAAYANLAAHMLSANYALDDDQLAEVLALPIPATDAGWPSRVLDIAHGRDAPKAGPAGSD